MNKKTCPKCESKNWMTELWPFPVDTPEICVTPAINGQRAQGRSHLRAEACGDCGYTEFYLSAPKNVLQEWRKQNA